MFKATKEQISEWKEKHGDVMLCKTGDKACYLKKPTRKALGYATAVGKSDPMKFNEILLNDCWLAGDPEIKTNDKYFLGVSGKLSELIEVAEAELVKL